MVGGGSDGRRSRMPEGGFTESIGGGGAGSAAIGDGPYVRVFLRCIGVLPGC